MSLVIPPGYGNAAFIFTSSTGTAPFVTTLGVDLSAAGGDFVGAANTLMTYYAQNLGAITDNDLTLERVSLSVGQDGPGGSVDSDLPPIAMTNNGTFGPVAIGVLIRKVTNVLGRRGRGRMFLPGTNLESGTEVDGTLTSAYRSTITSAINNFFEELSEGSDPLLAYPPVLLHSAAPTDPDPITGLVVADLVGVIRGRIR